MGVVTVSCSASRTPVGLNAKFSTQRYPSERPLILAFKSDKIQNTSLSAPHEPVLLPIESPKGNRKRIRRTPKPTKRVKAVSTDEVLPCTIDVDYNEAAAKLEKIYKRSPPSDVSDVEDTNHAVKKGRRRRKKISEGEEKAKKGTSNNVVRNQCQKVKRLSLVKRIELSKESEVATPTREKKDAKQEDEKIERLVREYSASTDSISLDWKKMKIPPVLHSSEHTWLFKLMQPIKALLQVKENLQNDLGREPTDGELAQATNMSTAQVRKQMKVGQAARNKLIKHNLRLVFICNQQIFSRVCKQPKIPRPLSSRSQGPYHSN